MTSMPRIFIILLLLSGNFFVILVPFEILSHYPNIDFYQWLKEGVQWSIDKIFGEKIASIGCENFFSTAFFDF